MMGPEKSGFFTLETGLSPETGLWEKQDFPPSLVFMDIIEETKDFKY